jgi:hypothetical protein
MQEKTRKSDADVWQSAQEVHRPGACEDPAVIGNEDV